MWGQKQLLWIKSCPNAETSWEQVHISQKDEAISNDTSLAKVAFSSNSTHKGQWGIWRATMLGTGLWQLPGRSWEYCQTCNVLGRSHLPNISRTFCSSPCLAEKYNCFGWNRNFLGLQEWGKEAWLILTEEHSQHFTPPHCYPVCMTKSMVHSRVPAKHKINKSPEGGLKTSSSNHRQPCSNEGHSYPVPLINKFWVLLL